MNIINQANDMLNKYSVIILITLGVLGIPQIVKRLEILKFNQMRIKGYRETLLKNSLIFSFISPLIILVVQKNLSIMLNIVKKDIMGQILYIMINSSLILYYIIFHDSYMKKSVNDKVKKRYRLVILILTLEAIMSGIFVNYNTIYLLDIWAFTIVITTFIYLIIYLVFGLAYGDNRKHRLKEIIIYIDYKETYNCFLRISFKGKNIRYLNISENHIEILLEKYKLMKRIPMDKVKEITFHY